MPDSAPRITFYILIIEQDSKEKPYFIGNKIATFKTEQEARLRQNVLLMEIPLAKVRVIKIETPEGVTLEKAVRDLTDSWNEIKK